MYYIENEENKKIAKIFQDAFRVSLSNLIRNYYLVRLTTLVTFIYFDILLISNIRDFLPSQFLLYML